MASTGSAIPALMPRASIGARELSRSEAGAMLKLVQTVRGDSLEVELRVDGDSKLNALVAPVIAASDGRRWVFRSIGVTADSAAFLGPVTLTVGHRDLPLTGQLTAGFCLAGERLCRIATRDVTIPGTP